jgi:hypothetical protein
MCGRKAEPGRTETLRRLNRTEYQNAIRIRWRSTLTPPRFCRPMSGHGFDNVNVGDLSATLLNRYISPPRR